MVILIRVVGQNAVHPHADHFHERVIDVAGVSRIRQRLGKLKRKPKLLVELPQRQKPRIAGNLFRRELYHNRLRCEKIKPKRKSRL